MFEAQSYADYLDRASAEGEALIAESLAQTRASGQGFLPQAKEDGLCCDCDEPIEAGRLKINLARCLYCAQSYERKQQLRR